MAGRMNDAAVLVYTTSYPPTELADFNILAPLTDIPFYQFWARFRIVIHRPIDR